LLQHEITFEGLVGDQTLAVGSQPPSGRLEPWLLVAAASLGRSLFRTTWGNTCRKSATNFRHFESFDVALLGACISVKKSPCIRNKTPFAMTFSITKKKNGVIGKPSPIEKTKSKTNAQVVANVRHTHNQTRAGIFETKKGAEAPFQIERGRTA
jgi:hypothetical protein